jgi:hypothetical protein
VVEELSEPVIIQCFSKMRKIGKVGRGRSLIFGIVHGKLRLVENKPCISVHTVGCHQFREMIFATIRLFSKTSYAEV